MIYAPVMDMRTKQWIVGVSKDFQLRPLTRDEVEALCMQLNARADALNREAYDG